MINQTKVGGKQTMVEYFNLKEACRYLGYKDFKSIHSLIDNGLPIIKIGNKTRIRKSDIDKFMEAHKVVKTK